ncbi:MAG: methyltransferase domain-containing protein [Planctomycetes bacterium]|nr:methyltransferase domain-containing protein [Planctomycetota bacterium]
MTRGPSRGARRTSLSLSELVDELTAAVAAAGDLAAAKHAARLLGIMTAELGQVLEVPGNRFSRAKACETIRMLMSHPAMTLARLAGGTFVDLGCGGLNPLASLVVLKAAGAARCVGIDLDVLREELAVPALARTALELMGAPSLYFGAQSPSADEVRQNLAGLDLAACLQTGERTVAAVGAFPVEYRCRSADDTGLEDASVDGITSTSFLEHVADVDGVIAEMARISKPGAVGYHGIDGSDHRNYVDPHRDVLAFLAEPSPEPIVFGCNRVRPLDFVERFEAHGFEVLECRVVREAEVTEASRARMAEPFRSMSLERLRALGVRLAARRR